jgi:hypothetical protein
MMASGKQQDQIRESLTPFLEQGEQLRAVGGFQSGGMWAELPKATFFTIRNWWVGITDSRVILAKQSRLNGKILEDAIFSVLRQGVVVKGRQLRIASPDPKIPKRLRALMASGYDKDEFQKALSD